MKKLKNKIEKEKQTIGGFYIWQHWDDLTIEKGSVELSEYLRKTSSEEIDVLCDFLAPYVVGTIWGDGEESGDNWRVTFIEKGNYKYEPGELVYGTQDYYDLFMKEYALTLPKKLIKELEQWHGAMQI
jgi:hypothetical protein